MNKLLSKVVDTLLIAILFLSLENLTLVTFKFSFDLMLLSISTLLSIILAEIIIYLKGKIRFLTFSVYLFIVAYFVTLGFYCKVNQIFVLCACVAFSFLFAVLIDYFKLIKISVVLLVSMLFVDIFSSNSKIDKLNVFIFFGALVVLCITSICKKYNKNYLWITLVVSTAVALLFVSVVNIYPEKTETKSKVQYVTTNPTHTTIATKTSANYTTTVKQTTNVNRNNNNGAKNNVATVTRYSQVYTTTVANTQGTKKPDDKQDNIKVDDYKAKTVNIILLILVIILSLWLLSAVVVIVRYKLKKNLDIKKYNSLNNNEKCIYYYEKVKHMNIDINSDINDLLNKVQFSKYGADSDDVTIMKDYYISSKIQLLNDTNKINRLFKKYFKII